MSYGTALLWYADADAELGKEIQERLVMRGVGVSLNSRQYTVSPLAMNNARYFIAIITKSSIKNDSEMAVCKRLVTSAMEREKPVFVLIEDYGERNTLNRGFSLPSFITNAIPIDLCLSLTGDTRAAVLSALYWLLSFVDAYEEKQRQYDTLATIRQDGLTSRFCDQYSDRLERILQCIQRELRKVSAHGARKALIKEVLGCAEELYHVDEPLDSIGKASARIRINCLTTIKSIREDCNELHRFRSKDPFFCAVAIRLIHLDYCIRTDCAFTITQGDVRWLGRDTRDAMGSEQDDYYRKMRKALDEISDEQFQSLYDTEEQRLIQSIEESLLSKALVYPGSENPFLKKPQPLETTERAVNADHDILVSIAHCVLESNQLFDQFVRRDTPTSYLVPLRTSYERLSNYCAVIGASELRIDLIDRISQINQLIELSVGEEVPDGEGKAPANEIKSLLGLSRPTTDSFDAFISYSHDDEDVATKVYRFLRESSKETFFDRMSLPEMSDSDYEDAIMEALDKSRNLILVLSDLSALKSHWINLELKTFLHEVSEGRKADGNVLLIVSEGVWDTIIESNKRCLPIRVRACEIFKLGSYRSMLLSYL